MRAFRRLMVLATALAVAVALSACGGSGGTGELTSDESPVPAGMPVMYEFFTLS